MAAALALRAPLSVAQGALAVDNLTFVVGATTYRAPHVALQGASLSPADLSQLFSGDAAAIDARLAGLTAKEIVIPSLSTETRRGATVERGAYRDVTLEDVVAGRIGALHAAGGEQTVERGEGGEHYVWTAIAAKGTDLRQLAHIALGARAGENEALKPLVDEETIESALFENKRTKLEIRSGRLSLSGVKGRALPAPPAVFFERIENHAAGRPEATLLRDLVEALASFEVGALEARDLVANGKDETAAEKPYGVKIGRVALNRVADAALGEFVVENVALAPAEGGKLIFQRFATRDAQLGALLDHVYPRLGHVELKGLDADIPDVGGGADARMKFRLDNAAVDFANFRGVAPTKIEGRVDHLFLDLVARGDAPSVAQFRALGYRDLDLSATQQGEWRETTREATLGPLRIEGKDMGVATATIRLGNVSEAVFSPVALLSRAAALAVSLKSVDIALEGGDLVDRVLALEAKTQKTALEETRAAHAKLAGDSVRALLGAGPKASRIAEAVSAYVMTPKRLRLRLASQRGVSALDALARKPADILESMDVEINVDKQD